jgi:hypothetical protein
VNTKPAGSIRGPAGEDLGSVFAPDGAAVTLAAGSTQVDAS